MPGHVFPGALGRNLSAKLTRWHHRQRLHRAGSNAVCGRRVPVAGLALILGIDRFMSEARALTNLIGNGVATIVIGRWTGDVDVARMQQHLNNDTMEEAETPEAVLDQTDAHMPFTKAV